MALILSDAKQEQEMAMATEMELAIAKDADSLLPVPHCSVLSQKWQWAPWLIAYCAAPAEARGDVTITSDEGTTLTYRAFYDHLVQSVHMQKELTPLYFELLTPESIAAVCRMLSGLPLRQFWLWIPAMVERRGVAFIRDANGVWREDAVSLVGANPFHLPYNDGMYENLLIAKKLVKKLPNPPQFFMQLTAVLSFNSPVRLKDTTKKTVKSVGDLVLFNGLEECLENAYFSCVRMLRRRLKGKVYKETDLGLFITPIEQYRHRWSVGITPEEADRYVSEDTVPPSFKSQAEIEEKEMENAEKENTDAENAPPGRRRNSVASASTQAAAAAAAAPQAKNTRTRKAKQAEPEVEGEADVTAMVDVEETEHAVEPEVTMPVARGGRGGRKGRGGGRGGSRGGRGGKSAQTSHLSSPKAQGEVPPSPSPSPSDLPLAEKRIATMKQRKDAENKFSGGEPLAGPGGIVAKYEAKQKEEDDKKKRDSEDTIEDDDHDDAKDIPSVPMTPGTITRLQLERKMAELEATVPKGEHLKAMMAEMMVPKRVKVDPSSPVILPLLMEQEFVHPLFGPVVVTAELWYVAEEQPDHVKSRPSGYERYYQPLDPIRKKKQHVADVRVVYYHLIIACVPNHTPLMGLVGHWFSSLNASTTALGNSESGWKAWTMRDSHNKYTLGQATSVNGFRNHLSITSRPLVLPTVPCDAHVVENGRCTLCRKFGPLEPTDFLAEDKCPGKVRKPHNMSGSQCTTCGKYGLLPPSEACPMQVEQPHEVEKGVCKHCHAVGTLPQTQVCSQGSKSLHVRNGGAFCLVCRARAPLKPGNFPPHEMCPLNSDRVCFTLSPNLRRAFTTPVPVYNTTTGVLIKYNEVPKPFYGEAYQQFKEAYAEETAKLTNEVEKKKRIKAFEKQEADAIEAGKLKEEKKYPVNSKYYDQHRTDYWHTRELRRELGNEVPLADFFGAECRFECNEFQCVPSDDHVGPFQCPHNIWHEPYAEVSKREDKNGPMFYVPRSAAMIESDDDDLAAGMDACAIDESEEAAERGASAAAAGGVKRKKKAIGAPKRKKASKPQRQVSGGYMY
jgi:hypothetical protein